MDTSFNIGPGAFLILLIAFMVVAFVSFMMGIVCHDDLVKRIPPEEEEKYFPKVDNKSL